MCVEEDSRNLRQLHVPKKDLDRLRRDWQEKPLAYHRPTGRLDQRVGIGAELASMLEHEGIVGRRAARIRLVVNQNPAFRRVDEEVDAAA